MDCMCVRGVGRRRKARSMKMKVGCWGASSLLVRLVTQTSLDRLFVPVRCPKEEGKEYEEMNFRASGQLGYLSQHLSQWSA
eukprot:1139146-Pelagomonas_calceolata.AAC.2